MSHRPARESGPVSTPLIPPNEAPSSRALGTTHPAGRPERSGADDGTLQRGRSDAPRRIDCEPEDDDRTRGTPRSGRGRGMREDAPAGRSRRTTP